MVVVLYKYYNIIYIYYNYIKMNYNLICRKKIHIYIYIYRVVNKVVDLYIPFCKFIYG